MLPQHSYNSPNNIPNNIPTAFQQCLCAHEALCSPGRRRAGLRSAPWRWRACACSRRCSFRPLCPRTSPGPASGCPTPPPTEQGHTVIPPPKLQLPASSAAGQEAHLAHFLLGDAPQDGVELQVLAARQQVVERVELRAVAHVPVHLVDLRQHAAKHNNTGQAVSHSPIQSPREGGALFKLQDDVLSTPDI